MLRQEGGLSTNAMRGLRRERARSRKDIDQPDKNDRTTERERRGFKFLRGEYRGGRIER